MTEFATKADLLARLPWPWLMVSDLDGTLLDYHDYHHGPVDSLLKRLDALAIPWVLNTSKTLAEVLPLRRELGNRHPFIVENGSAIYIPHQYFTLPVKKARFDEDYYRIETGCAARQIRQWLAAQPDRSTAFQSLSEDEIELRALTGLDKAAVRRARQRQYSELLRWTGSEAQLKEFRQRAEGAGLRLLRGGRFLHLQGDCDKGMASRRLAGEYAQQHGRRYSLLAAGDGDNDREMLEVADLAILIRSPAHPFPTLDSPCCLRSRELGPEGWREVVGHLLDSLALKNSS